MIIPINRFILRHELLQWLNATNRCARGPRFATRGRMTWNLLPSGQMSFQGVWGEGEQMKFAGGLMNFQCRPMSLAGGRMTFQCGMNVSQ